MEGLPLAEAQQEQLIARTVAVSDEVGERRF